MLGIFNKFLDANEREINKLSKDSVSINAVESKLKKLTDSKLEEKAQELKKRAQKGEQLEQLLPEAFALIREALFRVEGKRLFDVQLMASTALHQGKVAEQKTGEGKTFSAAPAALLNSLTGQGVHIVTVNDYLARRDAGWLGPVYHLLGISVAVIIHEQAFVYDPKYSEKNTTDQRFKHLKPITRKEAYQADITYGTNNE